MIKRSSKWDFVGFRAQVLWPEAASRVFGEPGVDPFTRRRDGSRVAVRLGLRIISGLASADAARIVGARADQDFVSVADF